MSRSPNSRSRRNADKQTLVLGELFACCESVLVCHLDDFIIYVGVERFGNKSRADALDLMRSRLFSRQNGRAGRLNGDDLNVRIFGF